MGLPQQRRVSHMHTHSHAPCITRHPRSIPSCPCRASRPAVLTPAATIPLPIASCVPCYCSCLRLHCLNNHACNPPSQSSYQLADPGPGPQRLQLPRGP